MFFNRGILSLRKGLPTHNTPLTMVAARPGQSIVVFGAVDPILIADIARVTGLNGRTVVVSADAAARQRVDAAAADAGVLVDVVGAVPAPMANDPGFDLAVVRADLATLDPGRRAVVVADAATSVRPSQRVIVIEGTRRAGWRGTFAKTPPTLHDDACVALLQSAGLIAVRAIGTAEGQSFVEGRKPAQTS